QFARLEDVSVAETESGMLRDNVPFPEVLIDERDRFMASTLRDTPGKTIVAVVGKGHVHGITQFMDRDRDVDSYKLRQYLEETKEPSALSKYGYPATVATVLGAPASIAMGSIYTFRRLVLGRRTSPAILAAGFIGCVGAELALASYCINRVYRKLDDMCEYADTLK
ncbi:hypothetical protein SAMD00019534_076620, partial [Acytostelium subglobosum LB1]|uniref:hypothetical protein n=1 Tax=Acytostelium subglobosum LB1 TaxID=1410327 RepID=UPI00064519BC